LDDLGEVLLPLSLVEDSFPDGIDSKYLHVLVVLPGPDESGKLPSSLIHNSVVFVPLIHVLLSTGSSSRGTKRKADYTQSRRRFYKRIKKIPNPSSLSKPDILKGEQRSDDPLILNGRPWEAIGLPVALAHPAFGEFLDRVGVVSSRRFGQ